MPPLETTRQSKHSLDLRPAVNWRDVAGTVRALADSTDADMTVVGKLALGLSEPVRILDEVGALTGRALAGDVHALAQLKGQLASVAGVMSPKPVAMPGAGRSCQCDERCCCAAHDRSNKAVHLESVKMSAFVTSDRPPRSDQHLDGALLDDDALVGLLLGTARLYSDDGDDAITRATGAVVSLAMAASTMAGLVEAFQRDGSAGVGGYVNELGMGGNLDWLVGPGVSNPTMTMMSGDLGPGGLPGGGLPGGWKPPRTVEDILNQLRPKRPYVWDPDNWCPTYPWWRQDPGFIDWRVIDRIRCLIEAFRLLQERLSLLPPARPTPVTWADGITSINGGACAGDTITINGRGFPSQSEAVLLLPTLEGCAPVAVPAADWSPTRITVALPRTIASGPVGFADAAYVTAFNAWVAEQNRLADIIRRKGCYTGRIPWMKPFHECPPDTPVNHLQAGAAVIDSFTANGLTMAVVEAGQGFLLAWSVRNADRIRVERISGSGPTFAGSTSLANPAATSYSLPSVAYSAPTAFVYRITAEGPCGSVSRDVTIAASRRPSLRIGSVEVTQGIQDTSNGVRLVESKPTVVRVTVWHGLAGWGSNSVPNVQGRIRVRRGNGSLSPWWDAANGSVPMAASPGASITVAANPSRNNTNDTLNFLIPPAWNSGTAAYEIQVRVAGFGAVGSFTGFSQQASLTTGSFSFQRRRTLDFRYIRVNWGGSTPSDQVCLDTLRGAVPLLPTPTANISALAGVGVQNPTANAAGQQALLDDFDDRHNCSFWEMLTEWLGSDCPDDDGAIWVLIPGVFFRGQAKDIPSNVCFTPPSDGPYAAHELSHCLNQTHVGLMCSNGQQAQGGDAAGSWPNNAQLVDVPFDVTRNRALSLSGTGVFDVMTYCGSPNNTWPMPARWDRLWDQVGG